MTESITVPLPDDLTAARDLCASLGLKSGGNLNMCHERLRWLGKQMRLAAEAVEPDWDDQFAPKKGGKRRVVCDHCGKTYTENKVTYRRKLGRPDPLWWCPTPGCDGAGVGFDIHPMEARRG